MLNIHRLDCVQCTTPLEVELLAALVRERRLRMLGVGIKPLKRSVPAEVHKPPACAPDPIDQIPACMSHVWQIQSAVVRRFGLTVHDIKADRRQVRICLARHVAVILCHMLTLHSYPRLGRDFQRDHTTMVNSVEKMRWLEHELRDELSVKDPLGVWSSRAFEKTVAKPVDRAKTASALQPAVA